MSETPENKNNPPDPAERAKELHAENLAYVIGMNDPDFVEALAARKAVELEAEYRGRSQATQRARERQDPADSDFDQYPWGVDYLELDTSPQAILDRVRAAGSENDPALEAQREQALSEAMGSARQDTLALGRMTAERLEDNRILPDVRIRIQHAEKTKKFSGREFRINGRLRADTHDITLEDETEGWILPIKGQLDDQATVVLCKDGRILTAYGRQEKSEEENEPDTLYVKANRVRPTHTYSSYLDEHLESDLGMANLAVGSSVARASTALSREQAMQEAVVSLLIEHDISLDDGNDTEVPTAQEPTEVLETISDEEKEYRNQGGEYMDLRLVGYDTDALIGQANLVNTPDIVDIRVYLSSYKSGDALKHVFAYKDKEGHYKSTTLDQVVWSHMPPERREALKQAGWDPDDLEIGKHPIYKPYW